MAGPGRKPAAGVGEWHEAFSDVLRVDDRFYILATSALTDDRPRVLKHGETFAVFDHHGDVRPVGLAEEGVYHEDTRFLSSLVLRVGASRPMFLSSTVREDNAMLTVDLTNPDLMSAGGVSIPRGTLHILRSKFLWQGACYERVRLRNYGMKPVRYRGVDFHFGADFRDVFEVRGMRRERHGRLLPAELSGDRVVLGYAGVDGRGRRTVIRFSPRPDRLSAGEAGFDLELEPGGETTIELTVECEADEPGAGGGPRAPAVDYGTALRGARRRVESLESRGCRIRTSNAQFDGWLGRSLADLDMMLTETGHGLFPYAGVPWFSAMFGRDGLLTGRECLWADPEVARGVLTSLAALQADRSEPERDAEPGKILHEARRGEMAALGEVPFGRYYGSVDSTPLFVMLAGAHHRRTGDLELARGLWPHVERALEWIERHGDVDGDGFVEYRRRTPTGLVNQGWKDSNDSVFHADGSLAEGPIALCEVQAYVYAAWREAAGLARALGEPERADGFLRRAGELRERFEEAFWCDDLGTYALALDGDKRPCRVRSSNAGHCLFAGIASEERARRTAATLLGTASFSGWGVRTLAEGEARYNPMSYHNGSVWPHDNAVIAHGLARYGLKEEVARLLEGMFEASLGVELQRMPELFCGFERRADSAPTLYPVACAPQAWAAGAAFLLLEAALGLEVDAPAGRLILRRPLLPELLDEIEIRGLAVGESRLDLRLHRRQNDVSVDLTGRRGPVEVVIFK